MTGYGIDFINFIIDALNDQNLMQEALGKVTPKELYDFFQAKGYVDVPFKDCVDILKASKAVHGKGVNQQGTTVDCSAVPTAPGY